MAQDKKTNYLVSTKPLHLFIRDLTTKEQLIIRAMLGLGLEAFKNDLKNSPKVLTQLLGMTKADIQSTIDNLSNHLNQ